MVHQTEQVGQASQANGTPASPGVAWAARAGELAAWAWDRLVNRTDVWGGYNAVESRDRLITRPDGSQTKLGATLTRPARSKRGRVQLTRQVLERHFRAGGAPDVVGLHTTSWPANACKWGCVEIDWHGPASAAPEVNWRAARGWFTHLVNRGFRPLLTDSNGRGGYHLDVLFTAPVAAARLYYFLKGLVRDHTVYGLTSAPEVFPKQRQLRPRADGSPPYGNWVRVPGRHHTRPHWSRVWDGGRWLDGAEAVAFILGVAGDDPGLVPEDAEVRYRAEAYAAKLPHLGEGQGRDDVAYNYACFLARDLALPDAQALELLESWDRDNRPPKGRERLAEILGNARQYGQRAYGSAGQSGGAAPLTAANGDGRPPPTAAGAAAEAKAPTAYEIILAHFGGAYGAGAFRRGEKVYAPALGAEVGQREACLAPGLALVKQLQAASDCVRDADGNVRPKEALRQFKTWSPVAWVDYRAGLEEADAAEVIDSAAAEFRGRVAAGLYFQATFGVDKDGAVQPERRSLLQWCQFWAKAGSWQQVRSALLWCRRDEQGRPCVALRVGLFGQFGPRELAGLSQRKFADLAELYGVGAAQRAGGCRVVELAQEFLAEVLAGPALEAQEAG